jgi:hypothetical protein
MRTFTLQLTDNDLDVLLIALIDNHSRLRDAIYDERLCTNNEDTLEILRFNRNRTESILDQLKKQKEQQ